MMVTSDECVTNLPSFEFLCHCWLPSSLLIALPSSPSLHPCHLTLHYGQSKGTNIFWGTLYILSHSNKLYIENRRELDTGQS